MRILKLDQDWSFERLGEPGSATTVDLPHGAFVATPDGGDHWFGECSYRRMVQWSEPKPEERCALYVAAAMHTTVVLIDNREIARHIGGYLPFEVDLTPSVADGRPHELTLRVDNRPTPHVPPGKPFEELDFCWYGGLYRGVELRVYPRLHVTDPVEAGVAAGGGIFVRTLSADSVKAVIAVRVQVRSAGQRAEAGQVKLSLRLTGRVVASGAEPFLIAAGRTVQVDLSLEVAAPALWSPDRPILHDLEVAVVDATGEALDVRELRCGLRRIGFSRSGGFTINGRRFRLRGTNRHQEHPWVGYAVPPAADWRDARRIKSAGFDYVRLSHYPQSPAFLDACDELGIVVMNAIPGWQFIGDETFRRECRQAARALIRRDRNHPCVVLWELSLNETAMDQEFMEQMQALGHEEYPGDQMFTCGWIDRFDVFIHSRQHGELHRWRNGDKAMVVAEYGDWEFYASNEGFDQKTGAGVLAAWSSSRQFRGGGERALLQQAWNHVLAANDCLSSDAVLDGQWAMFDYARGYAPRRAAVGLMDSYRLPKFSYHFYRSQRHPQEDVAAELGGAMVFIASHWLPSSDLRVTVFSNCEKVELRLDGELVARRRPEPAWMSLHVPHPPLVFELPRFTAGELSAVGFVDGRAVAVHRVCTPGEPVKLRAWVDEAGWRSEAGESDLVFVHAEWRDAVDTLCVEVTDKIAFEVMGGALVSPVLVAAEAGIASGLIRLPRGSTRCEITARDLKRGWIASVEILRSVASDNASRAVVCGVGA